MTIFDPPQNLDLLIQADCLDNQNAGIHTYTKNIIDNFTIKNYKLIKLTSKNSKEIAIPQKKTILSGTYRFFYQLPKKINQLNPKIYWQPTHLLPLNINPAIKKIITIHDLSSILHAEKHVPANYIMHKLLLKRSILNSAAILTGSDYIKHQIQTIFKPNCPIHTIHLGGNTKLNIETPKNHAIPEKFYLYLGTIEPRKNLQILIDSYLSIKHLVPEKLVIIGNYGWKSKKILQLINNNQDSIIYLGFQPENIKNFYLQKATALVYPSIYEGFGLPPLEALQLGTPVITTNTSSLKELYSNYSLQFAPNDHQALASHLITISQNQQLQNQLSKLGIQYAQNFSWQKTANQTEKVFQEILGTPTYSYTKT